MKYRVKTKTCEIYAEAKLNLNGVTNLELT